LISRHVFNSKRRTKRSTGKSPAIPGSCFCLKKAYQTQKQLKSKKNIYISRHVFNSKRRTKRSTGKSLAIPGICFSLKKAYQTQKKLKSNKIK
jgi:riboflavin synthase alpha subunit